MKHRLRILLLLSILLLTACAASPTPTAPTVDHSGHSMANDSNLPFDAQFIDGMIVHHQGAIEVANEVLQKAEHVELKTMAEGVIAAQSKEIANMQGWRATWFADLPNTGGMKSDMGEMAMGDMQISSDESIPFDQRFLTAMISHHQGAIDMAKMAQQMSEKAEIKTLADAIIKAQQAEIEQMKAWLKDWYAVSQ